MSGDFLTDRRRALEASFFLKRNQKLLEDLKQQMATEADIGALADASGVQDESLLQELVGMGITSETLAALSLVPLVEVAWADGKVAGQEREAVLKAAEDTGVQPDSAARKLLEEWIDEGFDPELRKSWQDYVAALVPTLSAPQKSRLKQELIGRAEQVASAAGGMLGLNKVSAAEREVIDTLASSFEA